MLLERAYRADGDQIHSAGCQSVKDVIFAELNSDGTLQIAQTE